MQLPAITTFHRLVDLTRPGAPVPPVVDALTQVGSELAAARATLVDAKASAWLLGEVDRVTNAAGTLRDSLVELQQLDGMHVFDQAFAANDLQWDDWFRESIGVVQRAQGVLDARDAAGAAVAQPSSSTTSV